MSFALGGRGGGERERQIDVFSSEGESDKVLLSEGETDMVFLREGETGKVFFGKGEKREKFFLAAGEANTDVSCTGTYRCLCH